MTHIVNRPARLHDWINVQIDVLDQGYVILRDCLGSDESIVAAARHSYQKGTRSVSDDAQLIDYLVRHQHSGPLEFAELVWEVKAPITVARQWMRHRTASVDEMSGRYSEMPNEVYIIDENHVGTPSKTNRQARVLGRHPWGEIFRQGCREIATTAFALYQNALNHDVPREVARGTLPLSTYTNFLWKQDLRNFLHLIRLRLPENAQWEFQEYARAMEMVVRELFPYTHDAWYRHIAKAVSFSLDEQGALAALLATADIETFHAAAMRAFPADSQKSRRTEFVAKLRTLLGSR